jgi:hypothetical protein
VSVLLEFPVVLEVSTFQAQVLANADYMFWPLRPLFISCYGIGFELSNIWHGVGFCKMMEAVGELTCHWSLRKVAGGRGGKQLNTDIVDRTDIHGFDFRTDLIIDEK